MTEHFNMVTSRAPVRIDLTGGYTDVRPFCTDYVGRSVNFAVSLYTYAYGTLRSDRKIRITSKDLNINIEADSLDKLEFDGRLDLIKSIAIEFKFPFGIDITTQSEIPPSSGLGTSGSLGIAVAGLLNYYCGSKLTREDLAELAARAERKIGSAGGKQDQYASALGGCHFFEFSDNKVVIEKLALSEGFKKLLSETMILSHPGGKRASGDLVDQIMSAYSNGDKAVAYHLICLNEYALDFKDALRNSEFNSLIRLLKRLRTHQVALHPNISNEDVDNIFSHLSQTGGGKALGGAGIGSCLFWLFPKQYKDDAVEKLLRSNCKIFPCDFDELGLTVTESNGIHA